MSASVYIFVLPSCPHCNQIKPHFESLWKEFKDKANFYMIDASDDRLKGYVKKYNITQAPSFVLDRPGKQPVTIQTSNIDVLRQRLKVLL